MAVLKMVDKEDSIFRSVCEQGTAESGNSVQPKNGPWSESWRCYAPLEMDWSDRKPIKEVKGILRW